MPSSSVSSNALEDLIYWTGNDDIAPNDIDEEELESKETEEAWKTLDDTSDRGKGKRESMYISLFEKMTGTVVKYENHLLSQEELRCLHAFSMLTYNARYLLVRLALRKGDKWHRLSALKYESELGKSIPDAIAELCRSPAEEIQTEVKVEEEEGKPEIIDLTLDEDDVQPPLPDVSMSQPQPELDLTVFAEDEKKMSLQELLESLRTEELKAIAKERKLKTTQNRPSLISALLTSHFTQSTINFPVVSIPPSKFKYECKDKITTHQTLLPFGSKLLIRTDARLREIVVEQLGKCIRINPLVLSLFRRINLIFFRSTTHSPQILTAALLARAKKRFYPAYTYQRTSDIWKTRDDLVAYEEALELEAQLGLYLDGNGGIGRGKTLKTPQVKVTSAHARPVTGTPRVPTPSTVKVEEGNKENRSTDMVEESVADGEMEIPEVEPARIRDARAVKAIFESVYDRWKQLVDVQGSNPEVGVMEDQSVSEGTSRQLGTGGQWRRRGLKRFESGHVWTRIVQKGANALSVLKEYDAELEVLDSLLGQKRWRRGQRGRWHERKACILMTHRGKDKAAMVRAMQAVIDGLKDNDTHIIYRPKLTRRLTTLEKRLKVPTESRHICEGILTKSVEVTVEGIRVRNQAQTVILDATGGSSTVAKNNEIDIRTFGTIDAAVSANGKINASTPLKDKGDTDSWRSTGKSVWVGKDGNDINVETLALQHYESFGYKGFHSEGRIVCTLFGLLFWNILFAPVPGALETPYQSAPMDIAEDSFYFARQDLIEDRLREIEAGKARAILESIDEEHRAKGTWCVGVRWDLFALEDLLEIVDCLGGKSLSVICRLLCEDYSARGSGVPDLFVWNLGDKSCKFVEVKGPGDSLSENQKVWIDVLLRAGTAVELCHVVERGFKKKPKKLKVKKAKAKSEKKKGLGLKKSEPALVSDDADGQLDVEAGNIEMDNYGGLESRGTKRSVHDELAPSRHRIEVVATVPSPKKRKTEPP